MGRDRSRGVTLAGLVAVGLLVLGACARSDLTIPPEAATDIGTQSTGGPDPAGLSPDAVVDLAFRDLGDYWKTTFPELYGGRFRPLRGGLVPYGPHTPVPACGPDPIVYEDVEANALYCPDEDLIAWDRVNLVPDLDQRYGPLTVGIVMAHEYAHAIQARARVHANAVTLELQADCFAGAWVANADDRLAVFATTGDSLDQAIGGFLELRDTLGVTAQDPNAHGTGFDRVSAFQDGFDTGNDTCVGYEDSPPEVVSIPFTSYTELNQDGNLPIDQLVDPLLADLESFYRHLFESEGDSWTPVKGLVPVDPAVDDVTCGDEKLSGADLERASFYCVADDTIYIDNTDLVPSLDAIGDFALGGELARQYAFAAQSELGILDRYTDTDLHADCLTGVFAASEFRQEIPDQQLVLSPGDLDEIITAFLAFGGGTDASAFQRTAAFRTGFEHGFDACQPYLG